MLQMVDLRPGWQVLDAGCGTGLIALLGAPRVTKSGRVIGIDGSNEMLQIARHKAAQFGFTQCEFRTGDLEALDLPDAQMNAVLSQFALHHTEPAKSLHEFYRVLQPSGILVVHEWADAANTPNKTIFDILAKYRSSEASGILALARAQSERAYNFRVNIAKAEPVTQLAEAAGFVGVQVRGEAYVVRVADIDAIIELASAAPLLHSEMAALSEDNRAAFLREVRDALSVFQTASGLGWTYNVLTLVAHKVAR
jgi:ubiquinone/menaquinone biosynthesis C-methylase UbiE